jgi:hypothetical protein
MGKDVTKSARLTACPSRSVRGEAIEAAVWAHVAGMLADPERLVAQFGFGPFSWTVDGLG